MAAAGIWDGWKPLALLAIGIQLGRILEGGGGFNRDVDQTSLPPGAPTSPQPLAAEAAALSKLAARLATLEQSIGEEGSLPRAARPGCVWIFI
jgi:hypothetical protein